MKEKKKQRVIIIMPQVLSIVYWGHSSCPVCIPVSALSNCVENAMRKYMCVLLEIL